MRIIHNLHDAEPDLDVILTIGTFDGVHLGHQHLLRRLIARARESGRLSAALTFFPHPRAVLQPDRELTYLSTPEERAALMAALGLDLLLLLPFERQLADTPAEAFARLLYDQVRMRELWVGEDFAMGRRREGDTAALRTIAAQIGFTLRTVPPLVVGDAPVSSTRIRRLLSEGQVAQVTELLGRSYTVSGHVLGGARRGRALGFRTANLCIPPQRAMPRDGVYAVWVMVDGQRHAGVANVGIRPTFDAGERLLEVHLLDFEGDLYGKPIQVAFVQRLRAEKRFADGVALAAQIRRDIGAARSALGLRVARDG